MMLLVSTETGLRALVCRRSDQARDMPLSYIEGEGNSIAGREQCFPDKVVRRLFRRGPHRLQKNEKKLSLSGERESLKSEDVNIRREVRQRAL